MFNLQKWTRGWVFVGLAVCAAFLASANPEVGEARPSTTTPPSLGTAESFAVLGASAVVDTAPSVVTGNVGLYPTTGASIGVPCVEVTGTIYDRDGAYTGGGGGITTCRVTNAALLLAAKNDLTTAYNNAAGRPAGPDIGTDLASATLTDGVYHAASGTFSITGGGTLTLDGGGNPDSVFIFKMGSTLVTSTSSKVVLINGAQACNVYWQVGTSATLGTSTTFVGNIMADQSITDNGGSTVAGRFLASNAAVTLNNTHITRAFCAPKLSSKSFNPATITVGGVSTLTITFSNSNATAATITSFTDNLPSGMVIANPSNVATTCGGSGALTANPGGSVVSMAAAAGRAIPANSSCTLTVNVTTSITGSLVNTVPSGALVTSIGNSNVSGSGTLISTAVGLSKSFNPATITAGGVSTLTITFSNTNGTPATMVADFTDNLPSGMVIANPSNVATTCGGSGALTANPGGSTVTIAAGHIIPANSSCTLTVNVTTPLAGSYVNTLPGGTSATLTSNGGPGPALKPAEVPEADTWLLFGGGIGGLATWLGWQWRKVRARSKQ